MLPTQLGVLILVQHAVLLLSSRHDVRLISHVDALNMVDASNMTANSSSLFGAAPDTLAAKARAFFRNRFGRRSPPQQGDVFTWTPAEEHKVLVMNIKSWLNNAQVIMSTALAKAAVQYELQNSVLEGEWYVEAMQWLYEEEQKFTNNGIENSLGEIGAGMGELQRLYQKAQESEDPNIRKVIGKKIEERLHQNAQESEDPHIREVIGKKIQWQADTAQIDHDLALAWGDVQALHVKLLNAFGQSDRDVAKLMQTEQFMRVWPKIGQFLVDFEPQNVAAYTRNAGN